MRNNHFTTMRKMTILQNMRKEKEKLKKKNTSDRNNMDNHHMVIVN